jgi:hypothetical protein
VLRVTYITNIDKIHINIDKILRQAAQGWKRKQDLHLHKGKSKRKLEAHGLRGWGV